MKLFGSNDNKKEAAQDSEQSAEQKKQAVASRDRAISSGRRYIIKKPLLTEKASLLQASKNKYVFVVHPDANKSEIKKEVERLFDVSVERVNIVNQPRKRKVWRGHVGYSTGDKKAIVSIGADEKIDILPT